MYRAMYGPAQAILENAKNRCPVDTGNLRDSIVIVDRKDKRKYDIAITATETLRIETPVFYADLVEYGTRFMVACPFLRPAVDEERAQFVRDVTVFAIEIIGGIWTAPLGAIGGFLIAIPIEDIGDKAKAAYVNRRYYKAKLRGEELPNYLETDQSFKGKLGHMVLARAHGARSSISAEKRAYYDRRRLERARRRGGNG